MHKTSVLAFAAVCGVAAPLALSVSAFATHVTCGANHTEHQYLGTAGNDLINGGPADNTMSGDDGHDTMSGRGGADEVCGNHGRDTLNGDVYWDGFWRTSDTVGRDFLEGGVGCDALEGDAAGDNVFGNQDGDRPPVYGGCSGEGPAFQVGGLHGGPGPDTLHGGIDNDYLVGGSDDDWANGEEGFDRCDAASLETGLSCEAWV